MLLLLIRTIADGAESRNVRNALVLAGIFILAMIIVICAIWLLRKKKILYYVIFALIVLLLLPQIFGLATFVEWKDKRISVELVGEVNDSDRLLEEYFVQGKSGFTVTDSPPNAICGWGDVSVESLPQETVDWLCSEYGLDCTHYTYLFTKGIQVSSIEYSVWANGNSWYLGPKGFWRSFSDAQLVLKTDGVSDGDTIYLYRFPKKYIALRHDIVHSGSLSFLFWEVDW